MTNFPLAFAALIFAAPMASAEPTTRTVAEPSFNAIMLDFGQCVVGKRHDEVRTFLLAYPSNANKGVASMPSGRGCEGVFKGYSQVTFLKEVYRGVLANALVQADFAATGASALANRSRLQQPSISNGMSSTRPNPVLAQQEADLARIGECMVRADSETARRWLLTKPDSKEDAELATALDASFNGCAATGASVRYFNPEVMRGPLSLNYIRLAAAAPAGATN